MSSKLAPDASAPAPAPEQKPAAYGAAAMTDLLEEIEWGSCEVLNAVSKDGVGRVAKQGLRDQPDLLLESDADEQVRLKPRGRRLCISLPKLFGRSALLLITIAFKSTTKVHSFQIDAPDDDRAPKGVKLFVNCKTLGFDDAESRPAEQELELTPEQFGSRIELRFVKFQSVQTLTFFIHSNQGDGDVSAISGLRLWGTSVATTNMSEFKRVAGEKGEGHRRSAAGHWDAQYILFTNLDHVARTVAVAASRSPKIEIDFHGPWAMGRTQARRGSHSPTQWIIVE
eukprot:scaffold106343_cov30-Tisochrysis_lutea.AAC.1